MSNNIYLSGFTMVRNADKLYFPIKESILSILPIVDEFIVALGKGDDDDNTRKIIESIGDPKIKIIDRIWDEKLFASSTIFAHETNIALSHCKGKWCMYLQADEVAHEDGLNAIIENCKKHENDLRVDGLLFNYRHFWGDYDHELESHGLCRNEIRVIRNNVGIKSYKDALSFRKKNDEKLNVIPISASIFHYGYTRPPKLMGTKKKIHDALHRGRDLNTKQANTEIFTEFSYGPLGHLPIFKGEHPKVMEAWIKKINWKDQLNKNKPVLTKTYTHKHLKIKNRILTWFENNLNGHKEVFGFKNYNLVKK